MILPGRAKFFAFLALLAGVGCAAGWLAMRGGSQAIPSATQVLRIGHYQLETGVREGLAAVAAEYERLHPGVRIEQNAVPKKMFSAWMRTQFAGRTAPDLVQLGEGLTEEIALQNFRPLSTWLREPNPYDQPPSTDGAIVQSPAWRDTFIDGLTSYPSYIPALIDHYGVPNALFTLRVFYNRDLLTKISGSPECPTEFDKFMEVCAQAERFDTKQSRPLYAMASGGEDSRLLLDTITDSQMQRLVRQIDDLRILQAGMPDYFALHRINGSWTLRSPGLLAGHELAREYGRHVIPGFLQLAAEDALLAFVQQRVLFLVTTTQAYGSLLAQTNFPLGVARLPLPGPDHARFGAEILGPPGDPLRPEVVLGITREAAQPELALDFLRFLSSRRMSTIFAERTGWFPANKAASRGSIPAELAPDTSGFPEGIRLARVGLGIDSRRAYQAELHRLFSADGSVEAFIDGLVVNFDAGLRADLARHQKSHREINARNDSQLAAAWRLGTLRDLATAASDRVTPIIETQANRETRLYRAEAELNASTKQK